MNKIFVLVLLCALLTGCGTLTIKKVAADLKEYEQLGVKEIVVTGKFSHTDYTVTHQNGKRTAIINHSNAWVPQIRVVRETEDESPSTQ